MTSWTAADIPDQTGRTVLVTGANSGLGLRSAEALAARGAAVIMACRNPERAEAARVEVAAVATGPAPTTLDLDLADLVSVRRAADRVVGGGTTIDVLMNNAGLMAPPPGRTAQGFEMQFGVNHLGHFALTGLLLPALGRAERPRVVTTSSNMHRSARNDGDGPAVDHGSYRRWSVYGRTKLANLLFMRELGRQAAEAGSDLVSAAAHPGYASTHLQAGSAEGTGGGIVNRVASVVFAIGNAVAAQSDAAGALPQLYAATMPDIASGDYVGPDGPFEMRGAPKLVGMSDAARSDEAAARLWKLSEELTAVTYAWPT